MQSYDLIILGSGPGGYVAAIRASQLGMSVMVVEKELLGGVCLNWGCIPTKALLRTSEILTYVNGIKEFGLSVSEVKTDIKAIVNRSRKISEKLSNGIDYLFKKNKIEVIKGTGSLTGKKKITVIDNQSNTSNYEAKNIIISTGARPKNLGKITTNSKNIWNYKDAMLPDTVPKSLAVIGSGAIGLEFASFYNSLGTKVKVFEVVENIAATEDKDISFALEKSLKKRGILFKTNTLVTDILDKGSLEISYKVKNKVMTENFEKALIAIGITGNTENIGLENTKVKLKDGHIIVHNNSATDEEGIYAIGDVTGAPWLAHKASHEGVICVETIAGMNNNNKLDINNIPSCIYSNPQVASIGITEQEAKDKDINIKIGRFPLNANGKALSLGENEGFVKTIFNASSGELLGAHLIGSEVTELIHSFAIAMKLEATEEDIMQTIFPHPTLSESIHESVLDAFEKAIHI